MEKPSDRFNVGDEVMVKIVKLLPEEKKIGLSVKEAVADDSRREPAGHASAAPPRAAGSASLGDFMGDDLRAKATGTKANGDEDATPDD